MKRIIVLLTLALALMYSTVAFASCNLDTTRWRWVGSDDKMGVFYDGKTLRFLNQYKNFVEFWFCVYCPNGCSVSGGEHYHYSLSRIDYSSNTMGTKSGVVRDTKGNIIGNFNHYNYRYEPILPDSIGENIATKIREDYFRR